MIVLYKIKWNKIKSLIYDMIYKSSICSLLKMHLRLVATDNGWSWDMWQHTVVRQYTCVCTVIKCKVNLLGRFWTHRQTQRFPKSGPGCPWPASFSTMLHLIQINLFLHMCLIFQCVPRLVEAWGPGLRNTAQNTKNVWKSRVKFLGNDVWV